ncbi:MAG: hypothetical protein ACK50J_17875 [Planctomyces sp.]
MNTNEPFRVYCNHAGWKCILREPLMMSPGQSAISAETRPEFTTSSGASLRVSTSTHRSGDRIQRATGASGKA